MQRDTAAYMVLYNMVAINIRYMYLASDQTQKNYIELLTDIVYRSMHYCCYYYMLTKKKNNLQDCDQLIFTKIIIQHIEHGKEKKKETKLFFS